MSRWDVVVRPLASCVLVVHLMVERWVVGMGRTGRRASSLLRRRQRCEGLTAEAPA